MVERGGRRERDSSSSRPRSPVIRNRITATQLRLLQIEWLRIGRLRICVIPLYRRPDEQSWLQDTLYSVVLELHNNDIPVQMWLTERHHR